MDTNKYYIPTIEEFHVGFEYEYVLNKSYGYLDSTCGEYKKQVFEGNCDDSGTSERYDIENLIQEQKLRVKYLDHDDLVSLEFSNEGVVDSFYQSKEKVRRILSDGVNVDIGAIQIWCQHYIPIKLAIYNRKQDHPILGMTPIFYGIIKNKFELKVLLKQLCLIND